VARKLLQHPEYGINLVGFVDAVPKDWIDRDLEHVAMLGDIDRLPAIVRLFDIERVVIAFWKRPHLETLEMIRTLGELDVQVDIVPRFYELVRPSVRMHTVEGVPMISLPPARLAWSSRLVKRLLDLSLALTALVVLSPLLALIAIAIKLDSRGPVCFRQVRMGSRDRTFRIFKFRSMVAEADSLKENVAHLNVHRNGDPRMFKIRHDPRVTRVGRWLRRTSLDELPQLLNVVVGHMSLVGPRPLILDEDKYVDDWARRRLDLKPGITGLWQVLGRSGIPFHEMVRLDYVYVADWSLWGDIRLIFRTVPLLARSRANV
jgi:exopolysaccharide biosynthesis polyprenyl glycosylphosphotransferase